MICPVNQGEGSYKKAFKGAPLRVLSCGDYLVVGFAGGYVCVIGLKEWLERFEAKRINKNAPDASGAPENALTKQQQFVHLDGSAVIGLEPCADNASFVCATEAGYVYRFQLFEPDLNIEVRGLPLDAAGLEN